MARTRRRPGRQNSSGGGGAVGSPTQAQQAQEYLINNAGFSPEDAQRWVRQQGWDLAGARQWWTTWGQIDWSQGAGQGEATSPTDAAPATEETPLDPYTAALQEQQRRDQMSAAVVLKSFLEKNHITELGPDLDNWLAAGYSPEAIMVMVRDSPAYHRRFPAMAARAAAGNPISEDAYIQYEQTAASLEQYYGLTRGALGTDQVTRLLEHNVSAKELEDRVAINIDAARNAPKEVRDQLQRLYGVSTGDLATYYLDPDRAVDLIRAQYAASQAAGGAQTQGFNVDQATAERMAQSGLDYAKARGAWGQVGADQGLTGGYGETVDQSTLVEGDVFASQPALQNIQRVGGARAAKFRGGGGFVGSEAGMGIGSAAT